LLGNSFLLALEKKLGFFVHRCKTSGDKLIQISWKWFLTNGLAFISIISKKMLPWTGVMKGGFFAA
jgi:hypothetical protein